MDSDDKNYYFNVNFKLLRIVDFGNNMQHIDISTIDENKIKEEIYENFKPILEELENNEPSINLQWIFNWVYRDRIKQILYKRTNLIYRSDMYPFYWINQWKGYTSIVFFLSTFFLIYLIYEILGYLY